MHYTLNETQVFFIAKSVEEITAENQFIGTNVIRIYKEKIQRSKSITEDDNVDPLRRLSMSVKKTSEKLAK